MNTKVTLTIEILDPGVQVVIYLLAGAHDYIKTNLELHAALKKIEAEKIRIIEPTSVSETQVVAQFESPQGLYTLCVDSIDPTGQSAEEHWGSGIPWTIRGDTLSMSTHAPRVRRNTKAPLNRVFHVNPPAPRYVPPTAPTETAPQIEPTTQKTERGPTAEKKPWWKFW